MATFKGIKGFTVQTLSSDPTTASSVGQIYYNSTGNAFKYVSAGGVAAATWSSGGNLPATRGSGIGHAGTQTATLAFGGLPGGATLTYNGTSWSAPGVDMNVAARYSLASFGTQTAALACGGDPGATNNGLVEQYDGSSWTEKTEMNTGRSQNPIGAGTVTAGLVGGGNSTVNTETWDGSSWTEVNNLNTNRRNGAGGGIQTSAIYCTGDQNPGLTTNVETWDGTSWTEVNNVNTARLNLSAAFNGGNSEGLIFGGSTPTNSALTEYWDGSSWTELADLATARKSGGGTGTDTSAIFYGGSPGTFVQTEEFTVSTFTTKTFDTD